MSEVFREFRCPECGKDVGLEDGSPIFPCSCMKEPPFCCICDEYIEESKSFYRWGNKGKYAAHESCFEKEATEDLREEAEYCYAL